MISIYANDVSFGEKRCKKEKEVQKKAKYSGYKNWKNATKWQESLAKEKKSNYSVPDSCCQNETDGCGIYIKSRDGDLKTWQNNTINKMGCHYYFYKETKKDVGMGNTAGVVVLTLQLVLIAFASYLVKQIDPQGGGHH